MVPVLLFKKLDGKSSDLRLNYTGAGVSGSALTTISKMMISIEIDRIEGATEMDDNPRLSLPSTTLRPPVFEKPV
jgi:hypothetical protein